MYVGRIVEYGTSREIFSQPAHPYTRALIAAIPDMANLGRSRRAGLTGEPPNPASPPPGCPFTPRCPVAIDLLHDRRPELRRKADGQLAACHSPDDPAGPAASDSASTLGVTA